MDKIIEKPLPDQCQDCSAATCPTLAHCMKGRGSTIEIPKDVTLSKEDWKDLFETLQGLVYRVKARSSGDAK